jgi:hypothetical protein
MSIDFEDALRTDGGKICSFNVYLKKSHKKFNIVKNKKFNKSHGGAEA